MTYIAATITADTPTPIDVTGVLGDPEREQAINEFAVGYNTEPFTVAVAQGDNPMTGALDAQISGTSVNDRHAVTINWGDGTVEVADVPFEQHEYDTPGSYDVDVLLERDGQPSLARHVTLTVPLATVPLGDDVPEGTIEGVKAWVGDDPDRAQAALDAEESGQQRQTLIAWLEGKI